MNKLVYTKIKQYDTCPKQYHALCVAKTHTSPPIPQTLYGREIHTILDQFVAGKIPELPKNYQQYTLPMEEIKVIPGVRYTEHKMAVREDRVTPCNFFDPNYWSRGVADFISIHSDHGWLIDYKSGNAKYADLRQLKLMALLMFASFPKVNTIDGALYFLPDNAFIPASYDRSSIPTLWEEFDQLIARMNYSEREDSWPANPSGLCKKHCPVDTCAYNGRSKGDSHAVCQ